MLEHSRRALWPEQGSIRQWIDRPFSGKGAGFWLVAPLFFFVAVVWAIGAAFRRLGRPEFANSRLVNVICIGNVLVGGTGKSPLVRSFSRSRKSGDVVLAIVSRGMGKRGRHEGVRCVPGSDLRVVLPSPPWGEWDHPSCLSDESLEHWLLLEREPSSRFLLLQTRHRKEALRLLESLAVDLEVTEDAPICVILDDGLQDVTTPRNVNCCVWDPRVVESAPRFCLPVGPYREGMPWTFSHLLRREPVRIWSRCQRGKEVEFREKIMSISEAFPFAGRDLLCVAGHAVYEVDWPECITATPQLRRWKGDFPSNIIVLTGLAYPHRFVEDVRPLVGEGNARMRVVCLADHGEVAPARWPELLQEVDCILFTGKDLGRWAFDEDFRANVRAVRTGVVLLEAEVLDLATLAAADLQDV